MTTRVLFVCLGNICRSPTAEAVFARLVQDARLEHEFEWDSAGTGGWHEGEPAHETTREVARRRGVEITHRARRVRPDDFERFDLLLAMDESNLAALERLARSDVERAKVRLFRSFDPERGADVVPDPYYDGGFEEVFAICERSARALLAALRREPG